MLAERALQDIKNPDLITLETIKAAVPMNDGLIARVVAATADFDRATDSLHMTAPFTLVLSSGLNADFKSARLDIKGGNMWSDDPVAIKKDNASILAQSLKITDKGRVITFEGQVRMNVDPSTIQKQPS
jgi:lipopolysaccharide export system protein LptC